MLFPMLDLLMTRPHLTVLDEDTEVEPLHSDDRSRACACRLKELLAAGAKARVDPHRPTIYDLSDGNDVYLFEMLAHGHIKLLACRHFIVE